MRCLGKRIDFNACDVSKTLNYAHSSLSDFSQSYFLCTPPLKVLLNTVNMGSLLINTVLERSSMEERFEGIMHGFSCATKGCVLVGLFLLGSLSREMMNFM